MYLFLYFKEAACEGRKVESVCVPCGEFLIFNGTQRYLAKTSFLKLCYPLLVLPTSYVYEVLH